MNVLEVAYTGRNNVIDLELRDDSDGKMKPSALTDAERGALSVPLITKIELVEGTTVRATSDATAYFDWSQGGGLLVISLGAAGLAARTYNCNLVIFDTLNTDGIVWGKMQLRVE